MIGSYRAMCFGASGNGQAEVETEDGLLLAPMGEGSASERVEGQTKEGNGSAFNLVRQRNPRPQTEAERVLSAPASAPRAIFSPVRAMERRTGEKRPSVASIQDSIFLGQKKRRDAAVGLGNSEQPFPGRGPIR